MCKIRILEVSFDTHLQPYQLPQLRGAIISKVGFEYDLFHNHNKETNNFYNRYPLIQYKIDTHKGQMRPMILCIENAIEEAFHFFSKSDLTVNIKGKQYDLKIAQLKINTYMVNKEQIINSYRLHKWQALNPEAYKKYNQIDSFSSKLMFLEKRLQTHISSFASGVGCRFASSISIEITNLLKTEWINFKNIKTLAFTIDFKTNISLPDFIGLGKGSALGYGVTRIQKVI